MGFRFYRRIKIFPGISLNFSKSGISTSLGVRGARITFSPKGTRTTVGIPGTGISYSQYKKKVHKPSFYCPACGKLWYYNKIMDGEELICTCGHHFYLNRLSSTEKHSNSSFYIGCFIFVIIITGILFLFNSCQKYLDESADKRNYTSSERGSEILVESKIRENIGDSSMNTNIYFYKKEYHENERTWYLSGHYSNSIKNKSGSFFAKVRRPIKPNPQKRADYILDLLEIK